MKKTILWTEPTIFNQDITDLIENHYQCLPIKLSQNKHEDLVDLLKIAKATGGGVILSGGNDIFPGTYDQQIENGDRLTTFDIKRDRRELFVINYCFENEIPILAICRGFQLMLGVQYGLGLISDISGHPICHSPSAQEMKSFDVNESDGEYLHWVNVLNDELKEEFFERSWCVSRHHQAVHFSQLKYNNNIYEQDGLEVIGIADLNLDYSEKGKKKRDIIELARGLNHKWIGSQYHLEAGADYLKNPGAKIVADKFAEMINL